MTLRKLALMAAVMTAASGAWAQSAAGPILWWDIRKGMTDAEVRTLHPEIVPGERGTLVKNGIETAGTIFSGFIEMDEGRVVGVQLEASNADTQTLVDGMSARYGAAASPYGCDRPGSPVRKCSAVWNSKDGVAIMLKTLVAPGMSVTTIHYAQTDAAGL